MPSVSRTLRRIASTASGPFAPMTAAISERLVERLPSGTTWPISPMRSASSAGTSRAVNRSSMARV